MMAVAAGHVSVTLPLALVAPCPSCYSQQLQMMAGAGDGSSGGERWQ